MVNEGATMLGGWGLKFLNCGIYHQRKLQETISIIRKTTNRIAPEENQ